MPTMTPVKSSAIKAIGHDAANNELHVEYSSGETYAFSGVTAEHHNDLMAAPSIGRHMQANINGLFQSRKLP